jgi:hypothetical protein
MNLVEVAEEIQHRIIHIFGRDVEGKRATNGGNVKLDEDPHFRDYVCFYEVMFMETSRLDLRRSCILVVLPWRYRARLRGITSNWMVSRQCH